MRLQGASLALSWPTATLVKPYQRRLNSIIYTSSVYVHTVRTPHTRVLVVAVFGMFWSKVWNCWSKNHESNPIVSRYEMTGALAFSVRPKIDNGDPPKTKNPIKINKVHFPRSMHHYHAVESTISASAVFSIFEEPPAVCR